MKINVKFNCSNCIEVEGMVASLQPLKDGKLRFLLESFSLAKDGEIYNLQIPVVLAGRPAELFSSTLKNTDLIMVEGRLRMGQDSKKFKIMCTHIRYTTPIYREIDISTLKPDDGDN